MGRRRSESRIAWPPNLYATKGGGFKYRNPLTKRETSLGSDQVKAFYVARGLNRLLAPYVADALEVRLRERIGLPPTRTTKDIHDANDLIKQVL